MLRLTLAVSVFGVAVGGVSTMAWFQINNNTVPSTPIQTNNVQTEATVYQNNDHPNDDTYQTTPTADSSNTLSYNHSKNNTATNYFIRQYNAQGNETKTLQMYSNAANVDDNALFQNIKFDGEWNIYDSTSNSYYGYDSIDDKCPIKQICSKGDYDHIVATNLTGYYDIYFRNDNTIWINEHSEVTAAEAVGNETGYYIYGTTTDENSSLYNHSSLADGIPMYVNAWSGARDLGYIAGLRLSVGDVLHLASGETMNNYTQSTTPAANPAEETNLLNKDAYFSFSEGTITCNSLGYYCIALNENSQIYISSWDGKEVDGRTRYTYVYKITLDNQGASSPGTRMIYERYNAGFYLDSATIAQQMTTTSSGISIPNKPGYTFGGYYTEPDGGGTPIINQSGKIASVASEFSRTFAQNSTIYAKWTAVQQQNLASGTQNNNIEKKSRRNANRTLTNVYVYGENGTGVWGDLAELSLVGSHWRGFCKLTAGKSFKIRGKQGNDYTWFGYRSQLSSVFDEGTEGNIKVKADSTSVYYFWLLASALNTYDDTSAIWEYSDSGASKVSTPVLRGSINSVSYWGSNDLAFTVNNSAQTFTYTTTLYRNDEIKVYYHSGGTDDQKWIGYESSLSSEYFIGRDNGADTSKKGTNIRIKKSGSYSFTIGINMFTKDNNSDLWQSGNNSSISFTAITTTITLDQQSGSGGSSNVTATFDAAMPSATMPTRTGFVFGGYFTATGGNGTQYYNADGSSAKDWDFTDATKTLFAKWTAVPTYTLSASVDSGSDGYGTVGNNITGINSGTGYTVSSNVITVGGSTTLTATPAQDTAEFDYEFVRWIDVSTGNELASSGTITANLTVKAVFSRTTQTYTITITKVNGACGTVKDGTGTETNSLTDVPYGTSISIGTGANSNKLTVGGTVLTAAPISDTDYYHYDFTSWAKSSNSAIVESDITATATFSQDGKVYTISLEDGVGTTTIYAKNGQQGYYLQGNTSERTVSQKMGTSTNGIDTPTKTGYDFAGYYASSALTGTAKINGTSGNKAYIRNESETPNLSNNTTWYVKWTKVISLNRLIGETGDTSVTVTYGKALPSVAMPESKTGFTLEGYYTNYNGGGKKYINANGTSANVWTELGTVDTLYVYYNPATINLVYDADGYDNGSSTTTTTAGVYSNDLTTVTWTTQSFVAASEFYICRPSTSSYWKSDMLTNNVYLVDDGTNNNNIKCLYKGTYTVVLTLSSGAINITMNTIDATQFYVVNGSGTRIATQDTCTTSDSLSFTITNVVIPQRGTLFHVRDSKSSGWKVLGGTNSTTLSRNFTFVSDSSLNSNNFYNLSTDYQGKVDITFTIADGVTSCTIVNNSVELYPAQFIVQNAAGTAKGNTTTYDSVNKYVKTNISLAANEEFCIKVLTADSGVIYDGFWGYPNISSPSITVNDVSGCDEVLSSYFVEGSNTFENEDHTTVSYIKAKYHGVYTIGFNLDTHQIISISVILDSDNFVLRGYGEAFGNYADGHDFNAADQKSSTTADGNNVLDYVSFTMKIDDRFKVYDLATSTWYGFSNLYNDSATTNYIQYFKNVDTNVESRVDLDVVVRFTFTPTNPANSTISFTSCTENTNIGFDHAAYAGIYLEIASDSGFTTNVTRTMMHTLSSNTYRAQEGPIYITASDQNKVYIRIVETHSNRFVHSDGQTDHNTPNSENLQRLTEYFYVYQATPRRGFSSINSIGDQPNTDNDYDNDWESGEWYKGNGIDSYIEVSVSGTWTISLGKNNDVVHIDVYRPSATVAVEHNVPYYLIGRGMPGSDIRDCDFTTNKSEQLWTFGGNPSNIPCYVGKYTEDNVNPEVYYGTGITLMADDTFAIATASRQLPQASFYATSGTGYSVGANGIVEITVSGEYQIYIDSNEKIHITKTGNAASWTRNNNLVASTSSYADNVISIGANLDYSLLDAYSTNGYVFEVELAHTSSIAATLTYNITVNSVSAYVEIKNGDIDSDAEYDGLHLITSGTYSDFTRSITASTTTYTCIRISVTPSSIASMVQSGTYVFSITIGCSSQETIAA